MSPEEEKIQKIIQLKRYEAPPEGYFDDFLEEFQKRRESEAKPEVASMGIAARSLAWFRGVATGRLVVAGGLAYAAVIVVVLMWPKGPESRTDNREPVIFQPTPGPTIQKPPKKPQNPPEKF